MVKGGYAYKDYKKPEVVKVDGIMNPTFVVISADPVLIDGVPYNQYDTCPIGGPNMVVCDANIELASPNGFSSNIHVRMFYNTILE